MNAHRRITWCAGAMIIALAGLSSVLYAKPDRPDDKKAANYYPLNVGNQWNYKVSVAENSTSVQSRIVKMETFDNQELARLEATVNNSIVAVEHLKQTEQGIFRHRNNGIDITPPLCLLKYPVNIKPKEPMKWSGALKGGGEKGTYTAEATEESVEVPFGKFQAVRVVIKLEQGKGPGQTVNTTYWFVKDVGFVKQTVEAGGLSILMELEKYERAKESK